MMSDIRFYLTILMRRLPLIIAIVVLATGAAVFYALSLPRSYTSTARLLAEAPQVTEGLSSSTIRTTPLAMMNMVQQKVMARDSLIALAERHGMTFPAGLPDDVKATIVGASISFRNSGGGVGDTNVVTTVSVNSGEAAKAAAVAQDLIDQITAESTRQRTTVASGTLSFIQAEVARLSNELDQRSQAIMDFQSKNAGALPDGLAYRESRRAQLRTDIATAQADLESMRGQEQTIRAIAQNGADSGALQTQLEEVRAELSSARLVYSATNPRVTRLEAQEAQIEERIRSAAQASSASDQPEGTGNALADMQLTDLAQRRATVEARIPALQREIDELSAAIDATPANASALATLQRELDAAQTRYDEARARLVLAQNGERLEMSDQAQRITVLEAPSVPAWPTKPNRKLVVAAGFAGGLGLAGALVVLMELLGSRVRRSSDLVKALDITPIVTVPMLPAKARG